MYINYNIAGSCPVCVYVGAREPPAECESLMNDDKHASILILYVWLSRGAEAMHGMWIGYYPNGSW